jgi:O-antigen ligase
VTIWSNSALGDRTSRSRRVATLFLVFAALIEGLATVLAGGPIAQSTGDLRTYVLICCLLAGLLGVSYWTFLRSSFKCGSIFVWFSIVTPAYGLCQVVPLPINVVRVLSPARANLVDALQPIASLRRWVPISATPSATLYHCLLFCACATLFLVIYDLSKHFSRRPWIVTLPLIVVGAAQAIIGLVQASASADDIATGTYLIRNHYAGFLEMILPFSVVLPFVVADARERGTDRPGKPNVVTTSLATCLGIVLTALLSTAIISSLSRMGFIAALGSMVFLAVNALAGRFPSRGLPLIAIIVLGATAILVLLLPSARLVTRFSDLEKYGNDRTPAWRDTLKVIETYPVFGCGLGAYESSFLRFKTSAPAQTQDYAHNDYLQYLAEMGALGFTVAILSLATVLFKLRRGVQHPRSSLRQLSLACAASLLAIGIHSFVDFNLYVPANLFTLAWILGISAYLGERGSSQPDLELLTPLSPQSYQRHSSNPDSSVDLVIKAK